MRTLELGEHLVGVSHEIRRDIATVKLHTFNNVKPSRQRLNFFKCDDALLADLLHSIGDHFADIGLTVVGNSAHLGYFFVGLKLLPLFPQLGNDGCNGGIDAALDNHRAHAAATNFQPSRTMAWARTVAVIVPSPASSLVFDVT